MSKFPPALLLSTTLSFSACNTVPSRPPVIGEAFAGPAALPIHQEIAPRSAVVATAHYGDKLQIVAQRRHFLKVRTAQGVEGWVDDRNLLDSSAMQSLKQLAVGSKNYPSQGKATTYDLLNVHSEPNRQSPSYLQIQPGERVDVIGHRTAPRNAPPRKPISLTRPAPRRIREKKENSKRIPPPPVPPAPKPPADWIELSKMRDPEEPEPPAPAETKAPEPEPADDWTLIRNASGQAGWVLTRRIFMAIPDEVAQYAEGKRISSYFSLGKAQDEDKQKDTWLWTTIQPGPQPFDFEGIRVFLWNPKRHRYETAYIQRHVTGYFPVIVTGSSFSVLIEKEDGHRYRQHFTLTGNRVQFDGEQLE